MLSASTPARLTSRLAARVRQLETRLSQLLGEQAWHASGLGAPADIEELQRKLTRLEQVQIDLTAQLDERTEELRAAREANRELTRALNQRHGDQRHDRLTVSKAFPTAE